MNDKEIDNLFKKSLENMEAPVPKSIWSSIETELDSREKKLKTVRKKRTRYAIAASLTLFLCLSIFLYRLMDSRDGIAENKLIAHYDEKKPLNLDKGLETGQNSDSKLEEQLSKDQFTPSSRESNLETDHYRLTSHKDRSQSKEKPYIEKVKTSEHTVPSVTTFRTDIGDRMLALSEETKTSLPKIEFETAEVTIPPIRPLIQLPEQEDIMYAENSETPKKSLVTRILNTISGNLVSKSGTSIEFSNDEEGTIKIDVINSLARNRILKGSK